ncbi:MULTISPECIES: hypothetical protein [unclassified Mycobacterium]|uniref:hypothetical protein n=1 Tax=unclassified Mycobacterium TaxID=2642494 RepID=UPI000899056E|nr:MULTISPECIES: hypothetical protein [unclassified Mycobacterium]SEB14151.1 hypothetical protein SAMN04488580_10856 [Mycobacterium sp. 283mftsu]
MTSKFLPPTEEKVDEVLRRIPTVPLRRAFFEGLMNPHWVVPLAKKGAFSYPPEPEKTENGLVRDIYWPEIGYLVRVAPDEPEAVVNVLLQLGNSTNAWVRRGTFEVGANISADQAVRLMPLIKSWQPTGFGWRTDPEDLVAFTLNLLQGGQQRDGTWFAKQLFKPFKTRDRRRPAARLGAYWFEQGLPKVAAALGDDGLEIVLPWLVAYERISGHLKKDLDFSYFSRDSIRRRDDECEDMEQALIDAVRDSAVKAMLVDASKAKETLLGRDMLLGRKIALFSLGEAIRQSGDTQRVEDLLAVATELLFDERSNDDSCRIDYGELARAVATVSTEVLDPLVQFIELGSSAYNRRHQERMRNSGADEAQIDEELREREDRWRHRWLSAIGVEALPAPLRIELAELDSRYGVFDRPLEPILRVTGWVGPNSPVSQDEMAAMSPVELAAHLESWHDTGDGWGPEPSHEGQGRELTALISTKPKALDGVSQLVRRLRPTYLRALLVGWEAAVKADLEPDWTQTAEVIADVLGHNDESAFPTEGGRGDDDPDFRWAKKAAVTLLAELVNQRTGLVVREDTMSLFADLLTNSANDDAAWDEYVADVDAGMDALTISLNWQWPIRIRGLINLMSQGRETIWYAAARSALEVELSRSDPRGASRAVIGRRLSRLLSTDPEWLIPRIPDLFGTSSGLSAGQQIALTTAIAGHLYHSTLYDLLRSSMLGAIQCGDQIVAGWRTQTDPLQQIGHWVVSAIIWGHTTIDDALAHEYFSVVPPRIRGDALGHIGWQFMHAQRVDAAIRDRLAGLWDSRVAHVRSCPQDREELTGFWWFVKSGKFAVEWWLPRLKEAAELDPQLCAERYMIGKELALASDYDPRTAFDVLKLLLGGRQEAGLAVYDLTRNAVPMILARAIASGDEGLRQDAEEYMNELGEAGNLGLQSEVIKFIDGTLNEEDVDE